MFAPEIYKERRKILRKAVGNGLILFLGNEEAPMNYQDNTYRFRQDSSFLYYFGIQRPGLVGILDVDENNDVLFGREYTVEDIVWMGAQETMEDLAHSCAVKEVKDLHALSASLDRAKKQGRRIHYLPPYRADNILRLANYLGLEINAVEAGKSLDLVKAVIAQREIKSEEEIIQLHQAVDISVDMHRTAIEFAQPGMTEAEVTAEIHRTAIAAGGEIAFPIIATINGQTLHNHFHGHAIKEGDLFLVDAGFENNMCYAGDLSSTFPVGRKFTIRQRDIYQITLAAHQAAIKALDLGTPFREVHHAACITIFEGLKSLGLTKGDPVEAVEAGAHALFFPCGTGHMMGLDVHDMEDLGEIWVGYDGQPKSTQFGLKSLRLAKPLQKGHVFTIEPGIYFIPELIDQWHSENRYMDFINWDKVNRFRDFGGIRNEEDFVMTEQGAKLLGKNKPKAIAEIEALRQTAF